MGNYHDPFEPEHFYHIYNRANGSEKLFREKENYIFFLKKWKHYLDQYLDTWAYALIPNHFHFLVKVKGLNSFPEDGIVNSFLEEKFKRLFSSYALSFNKFYKRNGSLFQKRFKRIKVDSHHYLLHLIHYIHHNPIHHNFSDSYKNWPYSSFSAIISDHPTKVNRQNVLNLFNGKEAFLSYHEEMKNYNKIEHLTIE